MLTIGGPKCSMKMEKARTVLVEFKSSVPLKLALRAMEDSKALRMLEASSASCKVNNGGDSKASELDETCVCPP